MGNGYQDSNKKHVRRQNIPPQRPSHRIIRRIPIHPIRRPHTARPQPLTIRLTNHPLRPCLGHRIARIKFSKLPQRRIKVPRIQHLPIPPRIPSPLFPLPNNPLNQPPQHRKHPHPHPNRPNPNTPRRRRHQHICPDLPCSLQHVLCPLHIYSLTDPPGGSPKRPVRRGDHSGGVENG